jgi:hypothetical protein
VRDAEVVRLEIVDADGNSEHAGIVPRVARARSGDRRFA